MSAKKIGFARLGLKKNRSGQRVVFAPAHPFRSVRRRARCQSAGQWAANRAGLQRGWVVA
ncbi:MAG TPA: hypothetical protein VD835_20360 [Pyrinomonadaceae bacterium]|nr:hypothetical protein [Pyrinomonadaceae bacterium]